MTPVYSLHFCTALLSRFNELNDDDDDEDDTSRHVGVSHLLMSSCSTMHGHTDAQTDRQTDRSSTGKFDDNRPPAALLERRGLKQKKIALWATLWRLMGNVRTPSIARRKARDRLPVPHT